MPSVGKISINLSAGTATFIADLDKANAKLKDFGSQAEAQRGRLRNVSNAANQAGHSFQQLGSHGVTGVQATSAALRTLEGGITNNLRAAERFAANFLGLGPILQKVFPVAGGIALLGILGELVHKAGEAYDAFQKMREAPQRLAQEFRQLNAPLKQTNDELDLTNAKLENEIAKLSGKPQNNLKEALAEARLEADKLADSLDKDFQKLGELLQKNEIGFFKSLLGNARTDDLTKEFGQGQSGFLATGFPGRVQKITDQAEENLANIQAGNTESEKKAALDQKNAVNARTRNDLERAFGDELKKVNAEIEKATRLQAQHEAATKQQQASRPKLNADGIPIATGSISGNGKAVPLAKQEADQTQRLIELEGIRHRLVLQQHQVESRFQNEDLTDQATALRHANDAAELTRPYTDKLHELDAQLAGLKQQLASIGQGTTAETLAKGWAAAQQAIAKLNDELAKHHQSLTLNQQVELLSYYDEIEAAKAEAEWKTKLEQTTTSIQDRIASLKLLTAAIGQGYQAQKNAAVEDQLAKTLGKNAFDPQWMAAHQSDVAGLRSQFGAEYDAQRNEQTGKTLDQVSDQIELENRLAGAEAKGAEAVRAETLAFQLEKIAKDNSADASQKLIQAEKDLNAAQQKRIANETIAQLEQEIAATERLTAAQLGGAEAIRRAQLDNRIADIRRNVPAQYQDAEIQKATQLSAAQHQEQVLADALKTGMAYQNQLQAINEEVAALEKLKATQGDTLAIEISLKQLEQERVKILSAQHDVIGSAADGVKDFFRQMATESESAAKQVHDDLKSAFEGIDDELSKLMTGQKTNWASFLQSLGQKLSKQGLTNLETQIAGKIGGLGGGRHPMDEKPPLGVDVTGSKGQYGNGGALGKIAGILLPGANKRDGNTATSALFVTLTNPTIAGNSFPPPSPASTLQTTTLTPEDQANLGNFSNDELKQLAKPDEQVASSSLKTLANGATTKLPSVWAQIGSAALQLALGFLSHSSSSGGSGGSDSTVTESFASGGRPKVGKVSLVGEHGPELFVPDRPGSIIPNHKLAGFRAMGGPVDPGSAYLVGERGPEAFTSKLSAETADTAATNRPVVQYSIDARGATDPELTRQNVERAIKAAHSSAIIKSTQVQSEQQKRTVRK